MGLLTNNKTKNVNKSIANQLKTVISNIENGRYGDLTLQDSLRVVVYAEGGQVEVKKNSVVRK